MYFNPGQFKQQMLWERLRTLLQIFDGYLQTTQNTFELVDQFVGEVFSLLDSKEEGARFSNHVGSLHALSIKEGDRFDELG